MTGPPSDRGPVVGPFRLVRPLARGTMGEVWLAEHLERGTRHALKLLDETLQLDSEGLLRFGREAAILAALDHPSIVRFHASGVTAAGRPWYAMELVEGPTLADAIRSSQPLEGSLDALEQVCEGLALIHRGGLVHRDLKPGNLLLPPGGRARIADFGLAREWGPAPRDALTRTGEVLGTPAYMAREQVEGGKIGPWTDVWALGAILHELLTGHPPYPSPHPLEVWAALCERRRIPSIPARRGVPPGLPGLCQRALSHDPADRPADAAAFLLELRAARRSRPSLLPGLVRLLSATALLLSLAALTVLLLRRPAPPAPPAPSLSRARELARDARTAEALDALGPEPGHGSFIAAERAALLRSPPPGEEGLAQGVWLALAAEAGRAPGSPALAEARRLLRESPLASGSAAAQEALARVELLLHQPASAAAAASLALAAAPGDPHALGVAARARAAALEPEGLRLDQRRVAHGLVDPTAERELAAALSAAAADLSRARAGLEPGQEEEEARLRAANLWAAALRRALLARDGPAVKAARAAAQAELSPLLARIDRAPVLAARRSLVPAGASGEADRLREAELDLAESARRLGPRPEMVLGAVRIASRLGDEQAGDWARVWIGLAGDLPSRAILALWRAALDDPRAAAWVDHAARLAPDLPALQLWRGCEARRAGGRPPSAAELLALVRSAREAPRLGPALLQPLRERPLAPAELLALLAELAGTDDATALSARALARLSLIQAPPEELARAADEAHRSALADPGSWLAHFLEADALHRLGRAGPALEAVLARAEAAGPEAAEVTRLRVRLAGRDGQRHLDRLLAQGWMPETLEPLVAPLQLPPRVRLLEHDLDFEELARSEPPDLPRFELTCWLTAGHHLPPDAFTRMARLLDLVGAGPALRDVVQLNARRHEQRHAAAREAGVRAVWASAPAWEPEPLPPRDPFRSPALPIPGELFPRGTLLPLAGLQGLEARERTEGALHALVDTRELEEEALLSPPALADPLGHSQALLGGLTDEEMTDHAARWLAGLGEVGELHLAQVRAWGAGGDELSLVHQLAEVLVWEEDPPARGDVAFVDGLASEGALRAGEGDPEWAGLRADLLLALAGSHLARSPERERLLHRAAELALPIPIDADELDPLQRFWGAWRRARIAAALGQGTEAAEALRTARAALPPELPRWAAHAIHADPLRPALLDCPGYAELLRSIEDPR